MKVKIIFLLIIIFSIIACQKKYNEVIIFNINDFSKNNNNYEYIYNQNYLKISDLRDINLVKWILLNESGLEINQEIQMIINNYQGGIPLQIEGFPVYYKVKINKMKYNELKNEILSSKFSESWRFYEEFDHLDFVRYNIFELSCIINKNIIIFGFRNMEGVFP